MLLSLVFSVVLLGSTAASPGANSITVTGVVTDLTEACVDGVRRAVVDEIRSEQNRSIEECKTGQLKTVQKIMNGQQRMGEQLTSLQGQLSALQGQLTALQKQPTAPAPKECPAGWSRHCHMCYLIPSVKATWFDANTTCVALDRRARLASVHRTSSRHIKALVDASGAPIVWIGLGRITGDTWAWTDGTPQDYTNWHQGEPNNAGGSENCVWMYQEGDSKWYDDKCSRAFNILCQISLGEDESAIV